MTNTDHLYCLILAGGKGRRLWPESTVEMPKQFIDFFGLGRTMLQMTFDRFAPFLPPERILVSTNVEYYDHVRQQLPEIPVENILPEPIWRNTAPSIAWGTHRILSFDMEAQIIVAPSDQQVIDIRAFEQDVRKALEFIDGNNTIVALGVKPSRPEPGYGYIQIKDEVYDNIYSIQSFTEKPEREFAQMFMESGEFYWNTGIYMARAQYLRTRFEEVLPSVLKYADLPSIPAENRYVLENFGTYPNISLEKGIIEKTEYINIMPCHFGWADLGTWHSMYEAKRSIEEDNVVLDSDVILDNSHNNIIKVPRGHLAVINGLNGYIVIEKDNMLLICPKEDSSALIRKYSAQVEIR